jgi:D-3-phosphoglycerate dehydrogenase
MGLKVLSMVDVSACPDVLQPLETVASVVSLPADQNTLRTRIGEFDAYLASLNVRLDSSVLEKATRLRVIATPSTGLDHLDTQGAVTRGIAVLSLKDDIAFLNQVTATAEMAWCLLLATVRQLPWAFTAACEGDWARDRFRGRQLAGKTLGILGYGRLGQMVAEYGRAFRMNVLACDIRPVEAGPGVTLVDIPTLLQQSDVLSIHIHLNEDNRHLLDSKALAQMKPESILINTSRGAIIDETALVDALLNGRLAGAGLDVIDGEWNEDLKQHPLIRYAREHQNLVISPHLGGVTYESQSMAYAHIVNKLKHHLESIRG